MKKFTYKYWMFILLISVGFQVNAQTDLLMHGYRFVPQSNYTNPAFIPVGKVFVGIPVISSISNSTYSKFSIDDFLVERSDSLYLDFTTAIKRGDKTNLLAHYNENDILFVGFKIKENYLNFGIKNRMYSRLLYSEDLIKLIWNGNAAYLDEELNLSSTNISHDHFVDYYMNFAFAIGENVNLGIRAHYLQGLSSVQTEKNEISILTNSQTAEGYTLEANSSFLVNTSGLVYDSTAEFGFSEYVFNFKNSGFAFDIGADIKLSERVNITFSVLDLGKINWKSHLHSFESNTDSVNFSGITVDINTDEDVFQLYADSLADLIDVNEFEKSFSTTLPTRFYAGLEYYGYDRKNRLSFLFAGIFFEEKFVPSASVGFDRDVSPHFAFKINYSYLPYSPLNLGVGFSFNFNPFQFYVLTDNVISPFRWDKQKYLNFRFGLNIVIPEKNFIPKGEPVFHEKPPTF